MSLLLKAEPGQVGLQQQVIKTEQQEIENMLQGPAISVPIAPSFTSSSMSSFSSSSSSSLPSFTSSSMSSTSSSSSSSISSSQPLPSRSPSISSFMPVSVDIQTLQDQLKQCQDDLKFSQDETSLCKQERDDLNNVRIPQLFQLLNDAKIRIQDLTSQIIALQQQQQQQPQAQQPSSPLFNYYLSMYMQALQRQYEQQKEGTDTTESEESPSEIKRQIHERYVNRFERTSIYRDAWSASERMVNEIEFYDELDRLFVQSGKISSEELRKWTSKYLN